MSSGIYQIIINEKGYIGSSNNVKRRKNEHLSMLSRNKHVNKKLQNIYNKYQNIQFKILLSCNIDELEKLENEYLNNKLFNNELNIKDAARGGFLIGEKHKRSKITENKAINIIELINKGLSSLEISNELNISYYIVNNIKTKKLWKHLSYLINDFNERDLKFIQLCKEGYYFRYCLKESNIKEKRGRELFSLYSNNNFKRPNRKYTFEIMEKIREEYKFGKNITQLSKEFGINEGTIFLVINNKIYTR